MTTKVRIRVRDSALQAGRDVCLQGTSRMTKEANATEIPPCSQTEDEIGRLYDEIADLALRSGSATDAGLDKRIEALWARLRQLQAEEAERYHEAFVASLAMPIDAGAKILAEARALRRELENTPTADPATRKSDHSQT
ncbi:MAG TPA: hypothetical protein VGG06_10020 [Thermoanaerobaculia bacterium]